MSDRKSQAPWARSSTWPPAAELRARRALVEASANASMLDTIVLSADPYDVVPRDPETRRRAFIRARSSEMVSRPEFDLGAGDVVTRNSPSALTTLLGSGVSVCLWDPARCIGGMNHFVLPEPIVTEPSSTRVGSNAMRTLIERVIEAGAVAKNLRARIFGGACTLASLSGTGAMLGECNVAVAFRTLAEYDIEIFSSDVGGRESRRVVFHTDTGTTFLRNM